MGQHGENMGPSKLEKATELGVKIIDEHEFSGMI
jgi:BRCT domain type II-containing protein